MSEPVFVGIDAGGSKTVCLVGDARAVTARGESGPANPRVAGVDGFGAAVGEAARRALGDSWGSPVAAAWIGVAGGDSPHIREPLHRAAVAALGVERVSISHDGRLILAAAGVRSGIAVVCGTGSAVYGLAPDGREQTVGGWGHLLGDEGSGYDIARQALRAVSQAADGRGPATRLSAAIAEAWGVAGPIGLRDRAYPAPPVAEVAALARIVLALADEDEVAAEIVDGAARDLALAARTCHWRLAAGGPLGESPAVVLAGGLMSPDSALLARLAAELRRSGEGYRVLPLTTEPAIGALALARDGPGKEEDTMPRSDQQGQDTPKEKDR